MAHRPSPFGVTLTYGPLRLRRLALRVGVAELAQAVGVSRVSIWRIESGRQAPSADELVGCARALGVPMQELFTITENRA